MNAWLIGGIVVALIAVIAIAATAAFFLDLSSYTATGTQTLSSIGPSMGRALVIYDPGLSGAAKNAAQMVAGDLQQKGYTVDLAGVRGGAAASTSNYSVIVAGGPMYFAKATSSIAAFLKTLTPRQQLRLGVFVTTGSSKFVESDFTSLQQQVKSTTTIPAHYGMVLTGNETQNCADLVSNLLK